MEMALGMSEWTPMSQVGEAQTKGIELKDTEDGTWAATAPIPVGSMAWPQGRDLNGASFSAGEIGYWWTSSSNGSEAWYRAVSYEEEGVARGGNFELHRRIFHSLRARCRVIRPKRV